MAGCLSVLTLLVLIGSVNADTEAMRKDISTLKTELSKQRTAGKLWKKRYEVERRARESAEQRVKELQFVLNETFKRFAINYEEEADEDDQFSDEAPEQTKL